jgi:outer membrane protein OmpA-like peptidoglycan-associated protein
MRTNRHTGWILIATIAAGCTHAHATQQLVAARSALQQTRASGTVELEPAEVAEAQRALAAAETQPIGSVHEAHLAYLADRRARRAMADARRDRLELEMAVDLRELEQAEMGLTTLDAEVLFETDRAELRPDACRELAPLAESLRGSTMLAVIAGFTDARGSVEHNRELSQRRADAVRAYLLSEGVASAQVVAEGLGEASPIATNATEQGRALNRRVEVSIYPSVTGRVPSARAITMLASR